jgi:hypothetical protein
VSAWLVLGVYVALALWLGAEYQPKRYIEQHGLAAWPAFNQSALGQLCVLLTPLWARNAVIVPALGGLAVLSTVAARLARGRVSAA